MERVDHDGGILFYLVAHAVVGLNECKDVDSIMSLEICMVCMAKEATQQGDDDESEPAALPTGREANRRGARPLVGR